MKSLSFKKKNYQDILDFKYDLYNVLGQMSTIALYLTSILRNMLPKIA